jgi:hypothetical protein
MEEIKEAFNLFDSEGKQVIDVRELKVNGIKRRFIQILYIVIQTIYIVIQILLYIAIKNLFFLGCVPSLGFPSEEGRDSPNVYRYG